MSDIDFLEDACWLNGGDADPGIDYCRSCAEKERSKYGENCVLDGGWPTEHGVPPQCHICHTPLAATILDDDGTEIETRAQWEKYVTSMH